MKIVLLFIEKLLVERRIERKEDRQKKKKERKNTGARRGRSELS